jgi:hypothetical protein
MPTVIKVDVTGALEELAHAQVLLAPDRLLAAIGQRHLYWIQENLRAAGSESRWPPMSPNTVAARPQRQSGSHFSSRYQSQLQQSFTSHVSGHQVEVGTDLQYARIHHEGTRPFTIAPKRAKKLRFVTAGGVVFSRLVHHPGIPARQLVPSARLGKELAIKVMDAVVAQLRAEAAD